MSEGSSTPHFILVHGACHGAWCWYKVSSLLEKAGNKVSSVDLAGAGINPTDPNTIFTFEEFNKPLIDLISALPDDETIILVAHSFGGFNLTDALNKFGKRISLAIYLAAAMFKLGHSQLEKTIPQSPKPEVEGEELTSQELTKKPPMWEIWKFIFDSGPLIPTGMISRELYRREIFYNMSPDEDVTLASTLLRPSPFRAMFGAPMKIGADVDAVPRVYIKTMNDKMFDPVTQDLEIVMWPPSKVFTIESDHSAFFSAPTELFNLLLKAHEELL